MKLCRATLGFTVAALFAMLLVSCDPFDSYAALWQEKETYHTYWYLANDTDRKVFFRMSDDAAVTPIVIYPQGSYPLHYLQNHKREEFYGFGTMEEDLGVNSLHLFTEDSDSPVRIWWAEDRNDPGKQFFNEACWQLEIGEEGTAKIWTFRIEPSDMESSDPE